MNEWMNFSFAFDSASGSYFGCSDGFSRINWIIHKKWGKVYNSISWIFFLFENKTEMNSEDSHMIMFYHRELCVSIVFNHMFSWYFFTNRHNNKILKWGSSLQNLSHLLNHNITYGACFAEDNTHIKQVEGPVWFYCTFCWFVLNIRSTFHHNFKYSVNILKWHASF